MLYSQIHLGEKGVRALLCTLRANVKLDLHFVGSVVADQDLLRKAISGHHILEVGEQIRGRLVAAGFEDELSCGTVICNSAGSKSRDRETADHSNYNKEGNYFINHCLHS